MHVNIEKEKCLDKLVERLTGNYKEFHRNMDLISKKLDLVGVSSLGEIDLYEVQTTNQQQEKNRAKEKLYEIYEMANPQINKFFLYDCPADELYMYFPNLNLLFKVFN